MFRAEQNGISLVELILFIVIVGVAVIGVVGALGLSTRSSADPMVQKQALAIAEAFMEEVQLQPFTYCDPDDPNAPGATGAADCTGGPGGNNDESKLPLGPEPGESRTAGSAAPFDNVSDYNGYDSNAVGGIRDVTGAVIAGLTAYRARVALSQQALGAIPASDALLIQVRVDGPPGTDIFVVLDGYRVRYAPNTLP